MVVSSIYWECGTSEAGRSMDCKMMERRKWEMGSGEGNGGEIG
jgi:hypothetical protein